MAGKNLFILLASMALVFTAHTVRADSLDGNWCAPDGRSLSIDGRIIVTPGGTAMTGDYQRHTFSYTIPKTEPKAGSYVFMKQWSDEEMQMQTGSDETVALKSTPQSWNRCANNVS